MSNVALTWARKQRAVSSAARHVLLILADCADAEDRCWPSQTVLAEEVGVSRQSISTILRELEQAKLIARDGTRQRQSYCLSVKTSVKPSDTEPAELYTQCQVDRHSVSSELSTNPKEPSITQTDAIASGTTSEATDGRRAARGARLDPAWQPDAGHCTFAAGLGLDPWAIAERFRDYWLACPGQKGVKLDWAATWRNWCRREAERIGAVGRQRPGGDGSAALSIVDILDRVHLPAEDARVH